jgi:hypothetical protein
MHSLAAQDTVKNWLFTLWLCAESCGLLLLLALQMSIKKHITNPGKAHNSNFEELWCLHTIAKCKKSQIEILLVKDCLYYFLQTSFWFL